MVTVVIPFAPMPPGQNPNVGRRSNPDVYLRCAYVAFASVRRWNPEATLILATTVEPGAQWELLFSELRVAINVVEFKHMPPDGFARTFLGSLYLLDALDIDANYLLIIDPDVFCIGSLEKFASHRDAVAALLIPSPPTVPINGLSPREAALISERLDGRAPVAGEPPRHLGGELYGIPDTLISRVRERAERGWTEALRAWEANEPYFHTEEHVMTYALAGVPVAEASEAARRIWTAHSHRTVQGDEATLSLWHLPAEKDRGFARLYRIASRKDSWFWSAHAEDFTKRSAKIFGIDDRDARRLMLDMAAHARKALT